MLKCLFSEYGQSANQIKGNKALNIMQANQCANNITNVHNPQQKNLIELQTFQFDKVLYVAGHLLMSEQSGEKNIIQDTKYTKEECPYWSHMHHPNVLALH